MLIGTFQLFKPSRECREMAVLAEISKSDSVSQRGLARAAGVSATMINAYIDQLVGRGLIEVTGETNRSYKYHLTEAGAVLHRETFRQLAREIFELYARLQRELRSGSHDEETLRLLQEPAAAPPEAQSA